MYPKKMAAVIPAADALIPPMKAPMKPESFTSEITPFASRLPKPVSGTVAPQPAKSIKYLYMPSPPKITPSVT